VANLAPLSPNFLGTKRSVFANITEICRRMHRQPEHVIAFMLAEMGTTGSVDGAGRLVIKGRFMQKQVENVLRRYISAYFTFIRSHPSTNFNYSGICYVQDVQIL
jgi:translation initiation factor 2 subunit 2